MTLKSLTSVERSKNLLLQVSSSFIIKILLFFITYAQFPILNKFLTKEEFGLWVTFVSFYTWFILFDFGIGHGLKNILTEKLSLDDTIALKKYSSSGVTGTLLIAGIFIVLYEAISPDLFTSNNTHVISHSFIQESLDFTFYSCVILFLHNTLSSFMHSVQKASYSNYLSLLVNALLLLLVFIILNNTKSIFYFNNALVFLAEANFLFYLAIFILICLLFFLKYPVFIPDFRLISLNDFKDVISKGSQFFFIQLSVLIIYPIDSFILSNYVSPESAGDYNVITKVYSIILVIGSIINQSSWPSITEAYYKKDRSWLKNIFRRYLYLNLFLIIALAVLTFLLNFIISIWMRKDYNFPLQTVLLAGVLHIIFLIAFSLATILYATNLLKSQIIVGSIIIPLKIILIYFLVIKGDKGLDGILTSSLICFIIYCLLNLIYFIKKFDNLLKKSSQSGFIRETKK